MNTEDPQSLKYRISYYVNTTQITPDQGFILHLLLILSFISLTP